MKNRRLFFTVLFITLASFACNMVPWDEIVSLNITPTQINKVPKLYPGGNAECSTINIPGLVQTTGRNNYVPSTDGFEMGWPEGLLVKVENNKSVAFQIDGSINLGDGKCYKVGAVIVKGSDASNVYDYTDMGGVTMDKGLVPPNNSSGTPAGLSNLTFCFTECAEKDTIFIALKAYYKAGSTSAYYNAGQYSAASSIGENLFTGVTCKRLGVNKYPITSSFGISDIALPNNIGTVTVVESAGSLLITVTLKDDGELDKTWIYAGSLEGLYSTVDIDDGCPDYQTNSLWKFNDTNSNTVSFTIPY